MAVLGLKHSRANRRGIFARTQLPFVIGLAYVVAVVVIIQPSSFTRPLVPAGVFVGIAATVLAVVVPWESVSVAWMLVVPLLDVVAVAAIRADVVTVFPGATMLAILPILWVAFAAGRRGIVIALLASAFVVAFRFAWPGVLPQTSAEWANSVTLPLAFMGLSVIASLAGSRLRRHADREERAREAQARALSDAQDAETLILGILDTVDAGVAFFDADGRLEVANAMARRMADVVGFRLDEPPYAGVNVTGADRSIPIPFDDQIVPRALRGEVIRGHLAWLGPPEAQMATIASATPLRRRDGTVRGTVIVVHDVTELVEAVEVREQFLRTASHELRTPLTSVTGFLSLIDDAIDPQDTKVRHYIEVVMRRAEDLLRRISDLVVAADDGRPLRLVDLDLREVVGVAARRVRPFADVRGSVIEVSAAEPVPVRADRAGIEAVVTEVLTNAIKFGEPGTRVAVVCGSDGVRARVTVSNEGVGLAPAEQRRVFDRFYRTPHARAHAIQGYGLGLTTVRSIVFAHQGHVSIDSAPGAGLTFAFDVPVGGPILGCPVPEEATHGG